MEGETTRATHEESRLPDSKETPEGSRLGEKMIGVNLGTKEKKRGVPRETSWM